jgi:hypothetical protein
MARCASRWLGMAATGLVMLFAGAGQGRHGIRPGVPPSAQPSRRARVGAVKSQLSRKRVQLAIWRYPAASMQCQGGAASVGGDAAKAPLDRVRGCAFRSLDGRRH